MCTWVSCHCLDLSGTLKEEGARALYKGLSPALLRQLVYGGMRYGLYAPFRNLIGIDANTRKEDIPFWKKIVAGAGAGLTASFIANPTDLFKVRMQVDGMKVNTGTESPAAHAAHLRPCALFLGRWRQLTSSGTGAGRGALQIPQPRTRLLQHSAEGRCLGAVEGRHTESLARNGSCGF